MDQTSIQLFLDSILIFTMKFSFALTAATIAVSTSSIDAFTANLLPNTNKRGLRVSTEKRMAGRVDSSDLVAEAMKITEKYGATSAEARLAWEAVEEVDASDNSIASMGSLSDECEVDVEVVSQDCLEYGEALDELQDLLSSTDPVSPFSPSSSVAAASADRLVDPVKLSAPDGVPAPQSKELQIALEEARAITAEKGLSSPEAAVAWGTVEEIAASGNSNALGAVLTYKNEECFAEEAAKEACAALEELNNKIVGDQKKNL